MAELAQHLSGTQRWATQIVRTGERAQHPVGPLDRAGLEAWFSEGAQDLVRALQQTDPQQPTWNFGPEPRVAAFWSRRQAHEVAVHLWDACNAQDLEFQIDPLLAADGIDEVCTVFLHMRLRREALPDWAPILSFEPTDVPHFSVQLKAPDRPEGTAVILRATAQELLLVAWGRRDLQGVQIQGDAESAAALLAWGITP